MMGNDTACKTIAIGDIRMRMFDGHVQTLTNILNPHEHTSRSKFKEESFSSMVQVFKC